MPSTLLAIHRQIQKENEKKMKMIMNEEADRLSDFKKWINGLQFKDRLKLAIRLLGRKF